MQIKGLNEIYYDKYFIHFNGCFYETNYYNNVYKKVYKIQE